MDSGSSTEAGPGPRIHENVVYGHKLGMALTLDVYRPESANGAGVIFLNSGGYVSPVLDFVVSDSTGVRLRSDEEMGEGAQLSVRRLVEAGYTVFNVRHGSSPKFLVPEILDDVRYAVRFVRDHASEYGVDPSRLGAWGGSAGGHLALMLGTTPELGPSTSETTEDAPLAAVVAYYPPSEWVSQRDAAEEWARANYDVGVVTVFPAVGFPEELDPDVSPSNYATSDDPPTLIIHGSNDPLVPLVQGEIMHKALLAAGVATELVVIEGAEHSFVGEDAELALELVLGWFDEYLQ